MTAQPLNVRIELVRGDITRQSVDAIVNAANSSLLGGGGVDGAIHSAAGPKLLEETRGIGGCPVGEARISRGYELPAMHVIHTVGPVWRGGGHGEAEMLARCYRSVFEIARDPVHGIETVAFPGISIGIYGYPVSEAAAIALGETVAFLDSNDSLKLVRFVLFSEETLNIYRNELIVRMNRHRA